MTLRTKHEQELSQLHKKIDTLREARGGVLKIAETRKELINFLKSIHEQNPKAVIGYVAGSITSDGPKNVEENIDTLFHYAKALRKKHGPHIFASKEVFSESEQADIVAQGETAQVELRGFWREVLKSGHITDLFMIPGWEKSVGAKDEHGLAKKLGNINVHYVEPIKKKVKK